MCVSVPKLVTCGADPQDECLVCPVSISLSEHPVLSDVCISPMTDPRLPPRLTLKEVLSRSADCTVSLVTDTRVNSDFILKSSRYSLETEFKLQSSLCSPHIAKAIDHFCFSGRYHLLVEFCDASDLFTFLADKQLSELQAKRYFRQLALALAVCHRAKIAHLDVKPENCFLDSNKNLKLGDFGAAKAVREGQFIRDFRGTVDYMSPQQHTKQPYDALKADIFAAGKVLFEIALNFTPFRTAQQTDANYQLFAKDPAAYWTVKRTLARNSGMVADWSEELIDLLQGMLADKETHRLGIEEVLRHSWLH